jgi:hypothetical protein
MVPGVQLVPEVLLIPVNRSDRFVQPDLEILVAHYSLEYPVVLLVQEDHLVPADPDCLTAQAVHLVRSDLAILDFPADPEVLSNLCLPGNLEARIVLMGPEAQGGQPILVVPGIQGNQEIQGSPAVLLAQMVQSAPSFLVDHFVPEVQMTRTDPVDLLTQWHR